MNNILLLGSKSPSRKMLLRESKIPFTVVSQNADEAKCDWNLSLEKVVQNIARYKMEHIILPPGDNGEVCFVLTADTLSETKNGQISGKPVDEQDAIKKIIQARNGMRTGTGFCLDKKVFKDNAWQTIERIEKFVDAQYIFEVPDNWLERYMKNSIGFNTSGAIAIELYGAQFLKSLNGSYSTIVGLPLFELRNALESVGFF